MRGSIFHGRRIPHGVLLACVLPWLCSSITEAQQEGVPKVVVRTGNDQAAATSANRTAAPGTRSIYPWKTYVTCTVFWIGETPTDRNPTPNHMSSWDQAWKSNYGGMDDPAPENRIANFTTGDFRPKAFVPKLNPFYVALPYNDVESGGHKPEAARVIPWFARSNPEPGKTVCKGRWLQIYTNGRSCFAQWEDCGPWVTDDWEFVFGNKPPKNRQNGCAAIDISPAVRDYLNLKSGDKVHWRFIEAAHVPNGPWKKYGPPTGGGVSPDLEAQRRYLENLRKQRDQEFLRKPLNE